MEAKKAKELQKNKTDKLKLARTGERNRVKSKHNQNKSIITKVFETIISIMILNSSLTSSILGRLYINLMKSPTYCLEYSIICKDKEKGENEEIT